MYCINYAPEMTGVAKYTSEMCVWLAKNGHNVSVITGQPYYPEWKVKEGYKQFVYSSKSQNGIDVLRCPLFVPSNPTTITRLVHLLSFSASSFFALFSRFFKKPDMVVVVQPTLFCAPAAIVFSRLVGSKCVMHIQDYEVDAMFGLGMINKNKLAGFSEKIESFIEAEDVNGDSADFRAIIRAYQHMLPEHFERFVEAFKIKGKDVNATNAEGQTAAQVIAGHAKGKEYSEILSA